MSEPPSACGIPGPFDLTPFGRDLAGRVADYLADRGGIAYDHRDYCGAGLFFRGGAFLYAEVGDGDIEFGSTPTTFSDREAFVGWLAGQSDEALSGRAAGNPFILGNQRITRARLEGVLATHRLVVSLAETTFAARYYRLCDRFPPAPGGPGRCTELDVLAILAGLGRVPTSHRWQTEPWPCPVFDFGWPAGGWAGSAQVYLPNLASVQFWCYFDRPGVRAGDQFPVLARGAAEAGGLPTPDPPYPEPVYHSAGELREVLAELFALQDLATAVVVEKMGLAGS